MTRKTFRMKIVTQELVRQINPENKKLVERFLKEKATRSSPTTVENYKSDADIFFVWNVLHNENKLFTEIKKLEFSDFFSFASNSMQWKSARMNRMRSFLSSLSQFIEKFLDDDYPTFRNIILKTIESSPKEAAREKTILSDEQVEKLLKYLGQNDTQKACWLALAAFSGSRFSELLRFTVDLLDANRTAFGDLFLETTKPIKTKGRGKDGKLLHKYILKDRFLPYYNAWLVDRERIMKEHNQEHNALFIKEDGTPAGDGTVRSWISGMEKFLGVNLYPHALRHFLVTEFSRKNIPPMLIKDLVGWSSLEMVNLYNDLTSKDMQWKELDNLK
jgi:site-specific recombinase XerD